MLEWTPSSLVSSRRATVLPAVGLALLVAAVVLALDGPSVLLAAATAFAAATATAHRLPAAARDLFGAHAVRLLAATCAALLTLAACRLAGTSAGGTLAVLVLAAGGAYASRAASTPGVAARATDLLVVVVLLVPTLVVIALLTPLIRRDGAGSAIFRQRRVGRGGHPFTILKLRTMSATAGTDWCVPGDPRVTRLGGLLRRTHLDELPQMLNILRGEMTLVGPRPEQAAIVEWLQEDLPGYAQRHLVTPGITGWAQVRCGYAGSILGSETKLEHDLFYVRNRSWALDVAILLETARTVASDALHGTPMLSRARAPRVSLRSGFRGAALALILLGVAAVAPAGARGAAMTVCPPEHSTSGSAYSESGSTPSGSGYSESGSTPSGSGYSESGSTPSGSGYSQSGSTPSGSGYSQSGSTPSGSGYSESGSSAGPRCRRASTAAATVRSAVVRGAATSSAGLAIGALVLLMLALAAVLRRRQRRGGWGA